MAGNRTRRRISDQQLSILHQLVAKPQPALWLGDDLYSASRPVGDRNRQTKAAKRALRALARWQLVRLFMAPHPEADLTFGDYLQIAQARATRRGAKGATLSIASLRADFGGIAPKGNRKQETLWAEITEAGLELVRAP